MAEELKIGIKVTADTAGAKQAAQAIGQVADSAKKTGAASKEAGDAIDQFGQRGSAAKDAFEGLTQASNGGAGAIFGLSKAWKNLTAAFAVNPITAALAAVLGALTLIKKGFDLVASAAEKDLVNAFKDVGKQTELLKQQSTALAAENKKNEDAQKQRIGDLSKAFTELIARQEKAAGRSKENNAATTDVAKAELDNKEQQALAGAKTSEQRDAVKANFAGQRDKLDVVSKGRQLDSEDLQAKLKIRTAEEAQLKLRLEINAAELDLLQKRKSAQDAEALAIDAGREELKFGSRSDPEARGIQKLAHDRGREAALAREDADSAEKRRSNLDDQSTATDSEIDDGRQTLSLNSQRRKLLSTQTETAGLKNRNQAKEKQGDATSRLGDLRNTAREAGASGDFEAQDKAVAEIKKLEQELAKAKEAQKKVDEQNAQSVKAVNETIVGSEPPAALDTEPLNKSFIEYHGQVIALQKDNKQALAITDQTVARLAREVAALQRVAKNTSGK